MKIDPDRILGALCIIGAIVYFILDYGVFA